MIAACSASLAFKLLFSWVTLAAFFASVWRVAICVAFALSMCAITDAMGGWALPETAGLCQWQSLVGCLAILLHSEGPKSLMFQ